MTWWFVQQTLPPSAVFRCSTFPIPDGDLPCVDTLYSGNKKSDSWGDMDLPEVVKSGLAFCINAEMWRLHNSSALMWTPMYLKLLTLTSGALLIVRDVYVLCCSLQKSTSSYFVLLTFRDRLLACHQWDRLSDGGKPQSTAVYCSGTDCSSVVSLLCLCSCSEVIWKYCPL